MEPRSLQFIGAACAAERLAGDEETRVRRICTDSRHVQPGDLFFALTGERFNGHDFLRDAARKGAIALVVERSRVPVDSNGCALLAVDDTRKALGRLGAEYRKESSTFTPDQLYIQGKALSRSAGIQATGGSFDVKEVYGELVVPILADLPFVHLLAFEGGIRYSDYSTAGGVTSWKAGGEFSPVKSFVSASGKVSMPSTTSSRLFMRPSLR